MCVCGLRALNVARVHVDDLSRARLEEMWNATHDSSDGFSSDPFVAASTLYRQGHYSDLLKMLTRCINEGSATHLSHPYTAGIR